VSARAGTIGYGGVATMLGDANESNGTFLT